MLSSKQTGQKLFKLTSFKSGTVVYDFGLDKKKLLVGSSEKCDIVIDDPSISHYHAFITIGEEGGEIIDLASENGVYINHSKTTKGFFSFGDTISFGVIEFHVKEEIDETVKLLDQDFGKVEKITSEQINQTMPELPPRDDLVVIDGEYCDIVFDESHYRPSLRSLALAQKVNENDYIDTHQEVENIPIISKNDSLSVRVTVMCMGNTISVDYLPLKSTTYFISANEHNKKTVLLSTLNSEENLPFISVSKDNKVEVFKLKDHTCFNLKDGKNIDVADNASINFEQDDELVFNYKTIEVHLQYVETPPHLRSTPFFGRDRLAKVETAKIFSALMSVFLLLLLVDTKVPEEEKKKVAVIYRVAKKSPQQQTKKVAEKTADVDKDQGIKKDKQPNPDNKNRFAKQKPQQPKKAEPKKQAKSKPQKSKAVAKSAPAPVKKAPKVKAYKFQMKKSFASVFSSNTPSDTKVNRATSSVSSSSISSAKATTSNLKASSNVSAASFGSDYKGSYDRSTGAKGLSSKRGIDTSFIEPKTVVLGSMDPEILRKILQEYLPQFRHCYQQELETVNENLEGIIDLKFRITKAGGVTNINVKPKDTKFSKTGTNCMAGVLRMIKFPRPKGGGVVDVRQPLNFSSEKQKI